MDTQTQATAAAGHTMLHAGTREYLSFKLGAEGALGAVGPLVRLDHALVNGGLWPTSIRNLEPVGSDHVPFVISLAVDPRSGGRRRHRRGLRRRSA